MVADAEFDTDAEPVNIAVTEAGAETGDKAGAEVEAVSGPNSVAAFGLFVSGRDLSSEVVVAWDSVISLEAAFDPMVAFAFVAASEGERMMAPFGNNQGVQAASEGLTGVQLEATVVKAELVDKPESVVLVPFAEGMVGALGASAGLWLGLVTLVWVSTAGMESDLGNNLEGNMEVVLLPVDVG